MSPRCHDVEVNQPKGREAEAAERRVASVARRRWGEPSLPEEVNGEGELCTHPVVWGARPTDGSSSATGIRLPVGCAANQKIGVDERAV